MRDIPAQDIDLRRYTPVGVGAVLREPRRPGHAGLLGAWGAALALSLLVKAGLHAVGFEGLPVTVGATEGTLAIEPGLILFGTFSLLFGFTWGVSGLLVVGLLASASLDGQGAWGIATALGRALGLLTITLCYRAVPVRVVPRSPFDVLSFILVAMLGALGANVGALAYVQVTGHTSPEVLGHLTGGWIGPFIQWVFVVGPLTLALGPRAMAFKRRAALGRPWRVPGRGVLGGALTVIAATLVLSVTGNRVAAAWRLEDLLTRAGQPNWQPDGRWLMDLQAAVDGPQVTPIFSLLLILSVALVGYQVILGWGRSTEAQEAALRESEARSRALIDAVPDLVLRIRADGTVIDHKDGLGLLGTGDLKGRSITDFWPSRITHPLLGRAEDALARGSSIVEFRMEGDQGLRDYEARLVAFDAKEVIALVRDVTEQRSAARDSNQVLVRAARELRAPLTSVRGALGLLRGGVAGELGAKVTQLLDVAYRNAERMVRLADEILAAEGPDGPRGRRLKLEQVDLARLVEASVYEVRQGAGALGVDLELGDIPHEARVRVDPDRVVEVIHVLLENALRFSAVGGHVEVSVRRARDVFRVEVRDEGHGVPEAFQARIFRRAEGLTGLALAREIVLTLGGRIGFESKLGRGTSFWFELPEQMEQRQLKGMVPPEALTRTRSIS